MSVIAFDHVAIPTARPEEMLRFYRALGFSAPEPEDWRAEKVPFFSIQFGEHKINVVPRCFMWVNGIEAYLR